VKKAILGACLAFVWANIWAQAEHSGAEHFGAAHLTTSCSADLQPQFDRAVAMLHSFFFPETVKAFTAIATADPSCAMAYWGIAMSNYHPLWAAPTPSEFRRGLEAINKAKEIGARTQREKSYIEALDAFRRLRQSEGILQCFLNRA